LTRAFSSRARTPDDINHPDAVRLLGGSDSIATVDLAFYEVTNVAIVAWHDPDAARRLLELIEAVAGDGGLVRASDSCCPRPLKLQPPKASRFMTRPTSSRLVRPAPISSAATTATW
jgi:hypothetical protein